MDAKKLYMDADNKEEARASLARTLVASVHNDTEDSDDEMELKVSSVKGRLDKLLDVTELCLVELDGVANYRVTLKVDVAKAKPTTSRCEVHAACESDDDEDGVARVTVHLVILAMIFSNI